MSTRSSVELVKHEGKDWHLYEELMDEEGFLWLSFPKDSLRDHGVNRSPVDNEILVRIPVDVWKELTDASHRLWHPQCGEDFCDRCGDCLDCYPA